MTTPKVGHYIRWWVDKDGYRKSYAGTVVEEHPGWNYHFTVDCVDGQKRCFVISTLTAGNVILHKPEYINFTE